MDYRGAGHRGTSMSKNKLADTATAKPATESTAKKPKPILQSKEFGGREGPEPTRYGDWENKGIISDF